MLRLQASRVAEHQVTLQILEQELRVGRAWSEGTLIKLAYGYEQATKHRRPPASTPELRLKR